MNALINEMAQILELNAADMMHHMMDLNEEYSEVTPALVARSLLHTAFAEGGETHTKVAALYNSYSKAAA